MAIDSRNTHRPATIPTMRPSGTMPLTRLWCLWTGYVGRLSAHTQMRRKAVDYAIPVYRVSLVREGALPAKHTK